MPQTETQQMKSGYYKHEDKTGNTLRSWVNSPLVFSDDPQEQARDFAHMATCLAMLVAAHKMISMASDFSDEGNEAEIFSVQESIEDIIQCYSDIV